MAEEGLTPPQRRPRAGEPPPTVQQRSRTSPPARGVSSDSVRNLAGITWWIHPSATSQSTLASQSGFGYKSRCLSARRSGPFACAHPVPSVALCCTLLHSAALVCLSVPTICLHSFQPALPLLEGLCNTLEVTRTACALVGPRRPSTSIDDFLFDTTHNVIIIKGA